MNVITSTEWNKYESINDELKHEPSTELDEKQSDNWVGLDKICLWHEEKVIIWARYNLLCCLHIKLTLLLSLLDMYTK